MSEYPEHDKMSAVQKQSQVCGEFLDWLQDEKELHLAKYVRPEGYIDNYLAVAHARREELLAEFFEIDLDKIEAERRQMLAALREHDSAPDDMHGQGTEAHG